jgi:Fe-S-cluster containining protein
MRTDRATLMTEEAIKQDALKLREEYTQKLKEGLRKARTPTDYERLVREYYRTLDRLFVEKLAESGDTIACKAGCSYCCHIKVDALPIEVFYLVQHLRSTLNKSELDLVHSKAKANRQRTSGMTCHEQQEKAIRCPLLSNEGCCMCYVARPSTCRRYHSNDAAPCQAMFENTAAKDMRAEVVEVRYPAAAIFWAAQETFKNEGFDAAPYDLSSALDEVLSNPSCYNRWRNRNSAFPKDLIAKVP